MSAETTPPSNETTSNDTTSNDTKSNDTKSNDTKSADTESNNPKGPGVMVWTGRVISILLGMFLLMSAVMKFTASGPEFEEGLEHIGFRQSMIFPLAILELTCVVIYLIPQTCVIGAILLAGYMGGAICVHWRVGDPFVVQIVIGVLVWLGAYLREPRLRELIPLRQIK